MSLLTIAIQNTSTIALVYFVLIVCFAFPFFGIRREVLILGLVNNGGIFGLAALPVVAFASPFAVDYGLLCISLFVDLCCLAVFLITGFRIIHFIRSTKSSISNSFIVALIATKTIFFVVNYFASNGQYGIFSDDSRIDFLTISPLISKTRYIDAMIDFGLLLAIGARCAKCRKINLFDTFGVVAVICFGFLTGSKGGALLTLVYTLLFVYAAFPRAFSSRLLWRITLVALAVIGSYVYFLSEMLNIKYIDLIVLSLVRFVLNADARIMALDPSVAQYVLSHAHGTLLVELFRGPSMLLGISVAEFPIGIYQYRAELGVTNYVGSTNQLSAMFTTFGTDFWFVDLFLLLFLIAIIYFYFSSMLYSRVPGLALCASASLYWLAITFCQGFDAFVQMLPVCILTAATIWVLSSIWNSRSLIIVDSCRQ